MRQTGGYWDLRESTQKTPGNMLTIPDYGLRKDQTPMTKLRCLHGYVFFKKSYQRERELGQIGSKR